MTQSEPVSPPEVQPVEETAAPIAPVASAPVPAAPVSPLSGPYRVNPSVELAPIEVSALRVWPILGSSLWVFGVALWAFVVAGELTTSYAPGSRSLLLGEGFGALFVAATTLGSWGFALRRTLAVSPTQGTARTVGRAMAVAALSFVMWVTVTVCAIIAGNASTKNLDGKITVLLIALATAAAIWGRRLAGIALREQTPRERLAWRAFWIGTAVVTLLTLIEVAVTD
jgi:hypothetical protein